MKRSPEFTIKVFIGLFLLLAIVSVLVSCNSASGKRTSTSRDNIEVTNNRIRVKDKAGVTSIVFALNEEMSSYRAGDTVIIASSRGIWTILESPAYNTDTLVRSLEYKRVVILPAN